MNYIFGEIYQNLLYNLVFKVLLVYRIDLQTNNSDVKVIKWQENLIKGNYHIKWTWWESNPCPKILFIIILYVVTYNFLPWQLYSLVRICHHLVLVLYIHHPVTSTLTGNNNATISILFIKSSIDLETNRITWSSSID